MITKFAGRVVSVIIVSYRVKYYIEQVLRSLYRSNQEIEVFVVDNASGDDTIEYLSARYPDVHYIANSENVGFGKANNQALKLAKGKYVLFLNPDTIVAERTIEGCVNLMESDSGVGAIGVRMQYSDGHFAPESRRSVPTPFVSFCKMSGLGRLFPNSKLFARYHLSYIDKDLACNIEVVSGAYMFVRKEALDKVGGFDETFFMYGEDVDLSYRILKAGYRNCYLPLPILHYKGESTTKTSYSYAKAFYDAMTIFFTKHYRHYSRFFTFLVKMVVGIQKISTYIKNNLFKKDITGLKQKTKALFVGNPSCFETVRSLVSKSKTISAVDCMEIDADIALKGVPYSKIKDYDVLIYGTDSVSYNVMLDNMYSLDSHKTLLATYNKDMGTLITELEVVVL